MITQQTNTMDEQTARGKALIDEKMPSWAKSAIVAFYRTDKSDIQSDYFGYTNGAAIIIGWSKHKRDLFSEMRKAAAASDMSEIAHLGPGHDLWHVRIKSGVHYGSRGWLRDEDGRESWATEAEAQSVIDAATARDAKNESKLATGEISAFCPELPYGTELEHQSIEHREKYTGGSGYYLSASYGLSSAWVVEKWPLDYYMSQVEFAAGHEDGYKVPEKTNQIVAA